MELELENADHHSEQSGTSTKQRRVVPIFAYVKYSVKDAVTENTIVNKEICEYGMLLTLLSSAESVCASYKALNERTVECHRPIKLSCTLESICSSKHM